MLVFKTCFVKVLNRFVQFYSTFRSGLHNCILLTLIKPLSVFLSVCLSVCLSLLVCIISVSFASQVSDPLAVNLSSLFKCPIRLLSSSLAKCLIRLLSSSLTKCPIRLLSSTPWWIWPVHVYMMCPECIQ